MTSDLTHIWGNWASSYIGMICRFAKTNRRYEKCQFPSFVFYAGEGWREHSTHGMQDVNTIKEKKETLQGFTVVIVGDVSHSRVARSNIAALTKLGEELRVVAPRPCSLFLWNGLAPKNCTHLNALIWGDVIMMQG